MDEIIREGDLVLLLDGDRDHLVRAQDRMAALWGTSGAINASRLIGMRWGGLLAVGSKELLTLRPDARDLIGNIERGPQVVIPKDSSSMVMELGLSPGMTVIEGGAGSGALTLALLNSVGPHGKVVTYELRADHLEKAKGNIQLSPFNDRWDGRLGDVAFCDIIGADAFVVDIPDPERIVSAASRSLRMGGRFCSYIPTTNQMERVSEALENEGFLRVRAVEVLVREFSLKKGALRPRTEMLGHTGYMVHARWAGRS